MKRLATFMACLVLMAGTAFASSVVNSRVVPTTQDVSGMGEALWLNMIDTILTEMLPIMPSARNVDAIDVDSVRAGYLYGNPTMDSLTLDYLRGDPDVDSLSGSILIDTLVGQKSGGIILNDSVLVNNVIDVDSVIGLAVLRGDPDVDSLSGSIILDTLVGAQAGGVIINDTVTVVSSVVVGGGGGLDSLTNNVDGGADTLVFKIAGKVLYVAADREP